MKFARPVACCTTMWVAPLPVPVVPSIPSRNDDRTTIRTSTRTIEAIVKKARIFLRKTFFQMKRKYFTASPRVPRSLDDRRRLRRQHPLVQMELPVGPSRGPRVVRHHDDRLVVLLVQAVEQDEDLLGALRVQVPGRLVGHQDERIGDDGPRDGYALLLPARELAGVMVHRVGPPARQVGLAHRRDVAAVDAEASLRRDVDAGDQVEQGRLPRAGGPHQGDELPLVDLEVDVLQDGDLEGVPAVDLGDMLDGDQRMRHVPSCVTGVTYLPTFTFMPLARGWPAALATRASPPSSPSLISAVASLWRPTTTGWNTTRSSLIRKTPVRPSFSARALFGTSTRVRADCPAVGAEVKLTRADRSGRIRSSGSRKATLTLTVPFCRSADGMTCLRYPL